MAKLTKDILIGASLALLAAVGHTQELTEVRIGTNNVVSDGLFYIAEAKGFFKEQGIVPKYFVFDGGPKMIAPLGAGQIDVGAAASSAGLFNAVGRGINIKVVADKGSTPASYDYIPILVRKALVDSGKVKGFKDFKGLKVAESSKGGSPGSKLNEALKQAGLSYKSVDHVYMSYPQQVLALGNGSVDAAVTTEPSATQAIENGSAVKISDDSAYPNQQVAVVVYSMDFIKGKPDLAMKFMIAYLKAVRFYNDAMKAGKLAGPTANEVVNILIKNTNVKDPAVYRNTTPNGVNPNGKVNVEGLKKDYDFFAEQGYIEGKASVEQVVDNSYVENALKVLGPYTPMK
ncbi:ABC transporter substrate-binding protein [Noviherbaspirillum sp.]|uniref:ABC transporter substrate-binding protein n=1 Tax=Noviherbaspirillum sp. TaxID=1926288 RepID=UPI002B47A7EF|nr:ABC transporter substrate-binding protein [Noviherbaspirillum sp.]HJV79389.1 ABC transporter substrate-binding protein [Noviherbaspirillum sp.]